MTSENQEPHKQDDRVDKRKSRIFWFSILLLSIIGYIYYNQTLNKESMKKLIQSILSDNIKDNKVRVDFVSYPIIQSIPFSSFLGEVGIIPGQFDGYFTMARTGAGEEKANCGWVAVNFSVRRVGDGRVYAQIPGAEMLKVYECNS